jgi:hypothetical protein
VKYGVRWWWWCCRVVSSGTQGRSGQAWQQYVYTRYVASKDSRVGAGGTPWQLNAWAAHLDSITPRRADAAERHPCRPKRLRAGPPKQAGRSMPERSALRPSHPMPCHPIPSHPMAPQRLRASGAHAAPQPPAAIARACASGQRPWQRCKRAAGLDAGFQPRPVSAPASTV